MPPPAAPVDSSLPAGAVQLLSVMPEPSLLLAADGGVVRGANPAAAALLGTPAAALVGQPLAALATDPPTHVAGLLAAGARNRQLVLGRLALRGSDGQPIECRTDCARVTPAGDDDGPPGGLLLLRLQDKRGAASRFLALNERIEELAAEVARRRQAEAELQAQREWIRVALLSIGDAVIATDQQGRIALMNGVAERLTGWPRAEAQGRPIEEVMLLRHATTGRPVVNPVREVLDRGQPCWMQADTTLWARDGKRWPVDDSAAPIRGPHGELRGVILVFREITERLHTERERRALEQQLRHSQKMQAVGTLAGGIAHDFNNVVAAILSNAALLRDELAGQAEPIERVGQIERAGQRARRLVRQILAFSRQQPREAAPQDLRPLVDDAVAFLRGALPSVVQLRVELPDTPLVADVDAVQIEQVLLNLCTNAWHALSGSSGRIVVGLAPVSVAAGTLDDRATRHAGLAPGRYAHLWVADTGNGMSEAVLQRIFEPFFTTKARSEGTGLGLAVVHGIVRDHMGSMRVESVVGSGSTFHVYLPALADASAEPPAPRATPPSEMPERPHGLQRRVLYVDDDELMVMTVQALLARSGFEAVGVDGGARALEMLAGPVPPFDVLVTDNNMPGMSGMELLAAVRRRHPGLPVVLASGYVTPEVEADARRAGAEAVLNKEDVVEQLAGLILRVLGLDAPAVAARPGR